MTDSICFFFKDRWSPDVLHHMTLHAVTTSPFMECLPGNQSHPPRALYILFHFIFSPPPPACLLFCVRHAFVCVALAHTHGAQRTTLESWFLTPLDRGSNSGLCSKLLCLMGHFTNWSPGNLLRLILQTCAIISNLTPWLYKAIVKPVMVAQTCHPSRRRKQAQGQHDLHIAF